MGKHDFEFNTPILAVNKYLRFATAMRGEDVLNQADRRTRTADVRIRTF